MKAGEVLQFDLSEKKKALIREQEIFDNSEKDESKLLKGVAARTKKRNDMIGAKILAARKNK